MNEERAIPVESPPSIFLLGRFEVRQGQRALPADAWPRRKAAALLKRLAFERRLLKEQALEMLWPEAAPTLATNNLYKTLHVLRRTLDAVLGPGAAGTVFQFEDGVLTLQPGVWVDAVEFERLAGGAGAHQQAALEKALELYQGDLLPDDLYEEWTLVPRQSLVQLERDARLALASLYADGLDPSWAAPLLRPLLARDPADEGVHRELMRLYALAGRQHEALRQYQSCVDALAEELGVEPAQETTALYTRILSGELSPPAVPTALRRTAPLPAREKPRPLFVARERELEVLQAHLQVAAAGSGQVLFVMGEAGQGKTSLMSECANRAGAQHPELVVAAGACQALAGIADPYLPFRDVIAMLSGDWQRPWLGGDISIAAARRLEEMAPLTARVIAEHTPDLAGVLAPAGGRSQPQPSGGRALSQRQVFAQVENLLRELSARRPLLILLDDLQWIDAASASLLFYLARQLIHSQVMIVGAYRPSEVSQPGSAHPLAPVVQELVRARGPICIDLDALEPGAERSFVDALLNSEPNRLDSSFREALFRRTRGHPLFTIELLRTLKDQGDLVRDETGMWTAGSAIGWDILPARVEALIARRMDRMPVDLRRILDTASIEGESFTVEVLAQVQQVDVLPLLHALSQELDQHYRLVRELGDVKAGSQTITRYQFRHNLFQQYLYGQLSQAQRRHLHARVAAALEQTSAGTDHPVVPLAYHYLAAGDAARAVPYLIRAGDDARRRVALEEAAHFYQTALDHRAEEDRQDPAAGQGSVLHRLGETLLALGKIEAAAGRFLEAKRQYELAGNRMGMGEMQRLIGRTCWEQGERAKALDNYYEALAILVTEPEGVELGRAYAGVAQMHMLGDQHDEAVAVGERALALAHRLRAEDVRAHVLTTLGVSRIVKGEIDQGLSMLSESLERAEALGLPHDACRAYAGLGDSLVNLERYGEARDLYDRMLAYSRRVQAVMFVGVALVQSVYLDWWVGRWRQALERIKEIEDWMAASEGPLMAKTWASTLLGMMHNDLGLPERARAALTPFTDAARSANELQTTAPHLAQLARAVNNEEERAGLVQGILALVDSRVYYRYDMLPALQLACTWLVRTSARADEALRRLEQARAQLGTRQVTAVWHEVQAEAAFQRGDWARAAAAYLEAAVEWAALERPYDLLRVRQGAWSAFSRAGRAGAARAARQQAAQLIDRLAAELDDPQWKEAFTDSFFGGKRED